MTSPIALPDWLPWWVPLVVLIPVLLYLLVLLLMPFSVFGVKGRLDLLDARLDEIQGEIRALALRLPERAEPGPRRGEAPARPPIPPAPQPAAQDDAWDADAEAPRARARPRGERSEPRLDWPR